MKKYFHLEKFAFVDEDGDFYDAWNIFQYIVFGDVIYG